MSLGCMASETKLTYLFDVVTRTNVDDNVLGVTQLTRHIQRVRKWDEDCRP